MYKAALKTIQEVNSRGIAAYIGLDQGDASLGVRVVDVFEAGGTSGPGDLALRLSVPPPPLPLPLPLPLGELPRAPPRVQLPDSGGGDPDSVTPTSLSSATSCLA